MRTRLYYPEFEMDLQLQSPYFLEMSMNFTEQTGKISIWLGMPLSSSSCL